MSTARPSPLRGARPTKADLERFAGRPGPAADDLLPETGEPIRLLIVGINPGLWTAAVNAPFARPGNRFWPSLAAAGITEREVDASRGLSDEDEAMILGLGIGMTNLVPRATARADELTNEEQCDGAARLARLAASRQPAAVAVVGVTAFRTAFRRPKASLGRQDTEGLEAGGEEWPGGSALWVLPNPSGLNAHETVDSLADRWREVWRTLD